METKFIILIVVAVFFALIGSGIGVVTSFLDYEEPILLGGNEFAELGLAVIDSDHYESYRFTYESFESFTNFQVSSDQDIYAYAVQEGYEIDKEEDSIILEKESCGFSQQFSLDICYEETIVVDTFFEEIQVVRVGYFENE